MQQKLVTFLTSAELEETYFKTYGVRFYERSDGNGCYPNPLGAKIFIDTNDVFYGCATSYGFNTLLGYLQWLKSDRSNEGLNNFFKDGAGAYSLDEALVAMARMGDLPAGDYVIEIVQKWTGYRI